MTNYEKVAVVLMSLGLAGFLSTIAMSIDLPKPIVWAVYVSFIVGEAIGLIINKNEQAQAYSFCVLRMFLMAYNDRH